MTTNKAFPIFNQEVDYTYNFKSLAPINLLMTYGFAMDNNPFSFVPLILNFPEMPYSVREEFLSSCLKYERTITFKDQVFPVSLKNIVGCKNADKNQSDLKLYFILEMRNDSTLNQ